MKEKRKKNRGYQLIEAFRRYHELLPHVTEKGVAEMNGFVARTPLVSR